MRKFFALLLALSLATMGLFAGVATAEEETKTFVGYLEDAAMHSLYLHLGDGSDVGMGMNMGDEAVKFFPEDAGLVLGERLLVKAALRDGVYEATEITVLTRVAGVVAEYGKNGFSVAEGDTEHVFIVTDATVDFPENGFLPGDLVEVVYDATKEDEPVYQVFLAETLDGVVETYEDDYLLLTCEDSVQATFSTIGAQDLAVLDDLPADKLVTVTYFGDLSTDCDTLPADVYAVTAAVE